MSGRHRRPVRAGRVLVPLVCCVVLGLLVGGRGSSLIESGPVRSVDRNVRLVGLSPGQSALVSKAVRLFAEAGLPLPPVDVSVSNSESVCKGRIAFHRPGDGKSEIVLCYPEIDGREWRVLLHELGHAWANAGLSEERKRDFQEVRGWEHWRDYERADWRDNGTEQAAEIIKWAVSDVAVPVFLDRDSCPELLDAYRALAGREPVQELADKCGPPFARRNSGAAAPHGASAAPAPGAQVACEVVIPAGDDLVSPEGNDGWGSAVGVDVVDRFDDAGNIPRTRRPVGSQFWRRGRSRPHGRRTRRKMSDPAGHT